MQQLSKRMILQLGAGWGLLLNNAASVLNVVASAATPRPAQRMPDAGSGLGSGSVLVPKQNNYCNI